MHEPVLALGSASELESDAKGVFSAFAEVGVPIHLVIPYDDLLEEVPQGQDRDAFVV